MRNVRLILMIMKVVSVVKDMKEMVLSSVLILMNVHVVFVEVKQVVVSIKYQVCACQKKKEIELLLSLLLLWLLFVYDVISILIHGTYLVFSCDYTFFQDMNVDVIQDISLQAHTEAVVSTLMNVRRVDHVVRMRSVRILLGIIHVNVNQDMKEIHRLYLVPILMNVRKFPIDVE
jgi:hypothetical protein